MLAYFRDVLGQLDILSKAFQKDFVEFDTVHPLVERTKDTIKGWYLCGDELVSNGSPRVKQVEAELLQAPHLFKGSMSMTFQLKIIPV